MNEIKKPKISKKVQNKTKGETKPLVLKKYKVLLFNDEIHGQLEVIGILQKVFKFDFEKAYETMMNAHNNNVAICGTYVLEVAELKRDQLRTFTLTSEVEPE